MPFKQSFDKIRDIVGRRLIRVDENSKKSFPAILQGPSVKWISFSNKELFALIFVTEDDLKRIKEFQEKKLDPFPGLIAKTPESSAAFTFKESRYGVVTDCSVENSISFSIGPDSTFFVTDHTQSIKTVEAGDVTYKLALGYFLSFGSEITADNLYENLEDLIAYSIKVWRESHGK